jgi:hypothetical protein
MIVYPVPVEVTQARIQLVVDQTAKAPPTTINEDLKAVYDAKSHALQAQVNQHVRQHVERHVEQPVEQHIEQHVEQPASEPAARVDVKV